MSRVRSLLPTGAMVEVRFEGARRQRAMVEVSYAGTRLLDRRYDVASAR